MTIKSTLADLFGASPIRPLQEHMKVSASAADQLIHFFNAVIENNWDEAEKVYDQIRDIEHKADDLKKDLRLHLPRGLFLPVPRGDLLDLLTKQDKLANTTKDIAGLMLGRKMQIPEGLETLILDFVAISIANVHQAFLAVSELDELLESGFSGPELDVVEKIVDELNDLERKADRIEVDVRAKLFSLESKMPPVDVIFLYRVIETIGELADRSQKVGSRLLVLLAR